MLSDIKNIIKNFINLLSVNLNQSLNEEIITDNSTWEEF